MRIASKQFGPDVRFTVQTSSRCFAVYRGRGGGTVKRRRLESPLEEEFRSPRLVQSAPP